MSNLLNSAKKYIKKHKTLFGIICLLFSFWLISFVSVNCKILKDADNYLITAPNDIPDIKVVFMPIFESLKQSGEATHLYSNLNYFVEIYKNKKAKKILLAKADYNITINDMDEIRMALLDEGIAPQDIFIDNKGNRIVDSVYRAQKVFGLSDMLIILNKEYLPRTIFMARYIGINAYGIAYDTKEENNTVDKCKELFARYITWLDLSLIAPYPVIKDKPINVSGQGIISWDN